MKKNARKNLIHDIIKYQFQSPVSEDNYSSIPGIRPRPKPKILRPNYYGNVIDNYPHITDNDSIEDSCHGDRDCLAGEICLDGYCEPANIPLPDDDEIGELPNDPVNPDIIDKMQRMTEVFSNVRNCTQWFRDHNHTRHQLDYVSPNKARYDGTETSHRPILTDPQISNICNRLQSIYLQGIQPARANPVNASTAHILSGGRS